MSIKRHIRGAVRSAMRMPMAQRRVGESGGAAAFDPTQVTGRLLDLWADAGVTVTGAGVSSWVDRVAAYDFVQATDANRPPYVASWRNEHRAVAPDGASDRLTCTVGADALLAAGNDCTIYLFGELDTLNGAAVDNVILDFSDGYMMVYFEGQASFDAGWYDSAYRQTGQASTGAHCWCWALDSGVASGSAVYQDGVSLGTATVTNNGLGGVISVGSEGSPSAWFDGKIGRLLIYSGLHDAATIANMVAWGRSYYGLP